MTDRYVGPGGSDGNSGLTWALRKLTLNGVEDTPVVAGDTVYVGPGVYRERLIGDVSGGNSYSTGTVSVTNGSTTVTGSGTTFTGNVAAGYEFQIKSPVASETDGVANGTSTFTSAAGPFLAGMVGLFIAIDTRAVYRVATYVSATEITLEDYTAPATGWPASGSGLTFQVIHTVGPIEIASVDDNTTLTLTKDWPGKTLSALSYNTWNPIRYFGDVTGENTDGVGGIVRITGSDNDQTAARIAGIDDAGHDYRTFRGFVIDMVSTSLVDADDNSDNWILEDCVFMYNMSSNTAAVDFGKSTDATVRRCLFLFNDGQGLKFGSASPVFDANHHIENCAFIGVGTDAVTSDDTEGITVKNCLIASCGDDGIDASDSTGGTMIIVSNCVIMLCDSIGIEAAALWDIVEDYNTFYGNASNRSSVSVGANSQIYPPLTVPPILLDGFKFPWSPLELSEWSPIAAITGASEASDDFYGMSRPATASKNSWGATQFVDKERETGTTRGASAASIALHDAGRHQVFVPVTAVSTTINVYVYREANYAGTNPQLIVKQPGQADDTTTDAAAASQWNLLTTTLTPSADTDFVVVELVSNNTATSGSYDVFFDDLAVS